MQVQYVECIATGRRRNGHPGSLTLTGQVQGLLTPCSKLGSMLLPSAPRTYARGKAAGSSQGS